MIELASEQQDASSKVVVIQLWATNSDAAQNGWLQTMRANIHALNGQHGFCSMRTHASFDGRFVAVYATWDSHGAAQTAVKSERAVEGHEALMLWGTPQGAEFQVVDIFGPQSANQEDTDLRFWARFFIELSAKVSALSSLSNQNGDADHE